MRKIFRKKARKPSVHDQLIVVIPLLVGIFIVFVLASQIKSQFDSRSSAKIAANACPQVRVTKTRYQHKCKGGFRKITYTCSTKYSSSYGHSRSECLTKAELAGKAFQSCQASNTCIPSPTPAPHSPSPTPTLFPQPTATFRPPSPRPTMIPFPTRTPSPYPLPTPIRITPTPSPIFF